MNEEAHGLTTMSTVEEVDEHGPTGSLVVNVSVTVPLAIDGVYDEVSEAAFENVPLGALQIAPVAVPPITPERFTIPPVQPDTVVLCLMR